MSMRPVRNGSAPYLRIVCTDRLASSSQRGRYPRINARDSRIEVQRSCFTKNHFDEGFALHAVLFIGSGAVK